MEDRNAETLPMVASQKMKHGRVCDIVSDVVRRTSESVAIPLVRFSDRSLSKAIAATRVLTLAFNVALLRIKKDQTHEFGTTTNFCTPIRGRLNSWDNLPLL